MYASAMANQAGKIDEGIMFPTHPDGTSCNMAQSGQVSAKKAPIKKTARAHRLRGLASRLCQRGKLPAYNASKILPASSSGLISFIARIPRLTNSMNGAAI